MSSSDVAKTDLLRQLGYASRHEEAFAALDEAGLSQLRKERISRAKQEAVGRLLAERFIRCCPRGDCQARARADRSGRMVALATTPAACELCNGSPVDRATGQMRDACVRAGWRKLCIVGGSPAAREQLEHSIRPPLELRLIDGLGTRTKSQASDDIEWADHVVVWGGTQLAHSVSRLYSGSPKTSALAKRGVQELCQHVVEAATGR